MDDQTKCEIYTELLNSLNKNGELKKQITRNTYNSQVRLIKADLLCKVSTGQNQKTALQMLKILVENNVLDIQQEVITILKDRDVDQEIKSSIIESIRYYIKDLLHSHNVTNLVSIYSSWKNYDLKKFYDLVQTAAHLREAQEDSLFEPINFVKLIIEDFLTMMTQPSQIHLKQPLIEITTKIAEMYPISKLSAEEYTEVLKKVSALVICIVNFQKANKDAWQEPLHFLITYLDKKFSSSETQEMLGSSNWDLLRADLESNINNELRKYISENNIIMINILFRSWQNLDPQKFTTGLKEICHGDSSVCKAFLFNQLIPIIMAPTSDTMQVYYIDIALEFAAFLPLTNLGIEEYNTFLASVNDYIKNISDLRDRQFQYWHKLWIFLVRLFGKKLHHSMTLINRLLRVVEHAFRNPSYEQRIRGYDCWKELIDNVSLDPHHLNSEKQIRLLLTPLRAKFSKQETVIVKRFEVFVYLIEKLQDKAVLVLKEFLEFCFGEVGEDTDPNKAGHGKSLPELWHRSAKVLLAMLGHSHNISDHCLETNTELSLKRPVLNGNNISNHYCHTINSVVESCILLKGVDLGQDRHTVFQCFWTSLLGIVLDANVVKKEKCFETLDKALQKLLRDSDVYYNSIATEILKSTIGIDWLTVFPFVLNSLEQFIRIIFSVPLNEESYPDIEKFQTMLCTESPEIPSKIIQIMFHCFAEYKTIESNANFVARFWISLADQLDDYAKNKCLNFLVWPALHIHHVTDFAKVVVIYDQYKQIVTRCVEKSDELQLGLLKNFEKILKNNPLLTKNLVTLVTMFTPKTENKDITNVTLDILDIMMVVPATEDSNNHREDLELYLRKFYELNISDIQDHDTIKKLCTCLQHVLKYKRYDILNIVEPCLKSLPDNLKWVYGKYLSIDFLMDIFEKETDLLAVEKVHKLIDIFRKVKNPEAKKEATSFMPLGGRSAKIANLVKQIPSSPAKPSDSPTTLRLFGKDIETHSPISVKGSQLKNTKDTPNKSKTSTPTRASKKTLRIDDESTSKFVLIESEVKLDKSKLTEHQKEALQKRREDIPALYQDLSQSMTHDSNSASGKMDTTVVFKKPEESCTKELVHSINTGQCTEVVDDAKIENADTEEYLPESKNKQLSKADLKKTAVEAELKKLSMNIVGAEEFLATNSKRKRREKKQYLEGNKEKSSKGTSVTPKADKSILITPKQIIEETNKTCDVDNKLEEPETVQGKKQGGKSRRKSVLNKAGSEGSVQQDSTNKSTDNIAEKSELSAKISLESNKIGGSEINILDKKNNSSKGGNQLKVTNEPPERQFVEEEMNDTVKLGFVAEIDKTPADIKPKPNKEGNLVIKKDPLLNTAEVVKKKGRPPGSKKTPFKQGSPKGRILQTPVKIVEDADTASIEKSSLIEECGASVKAENDSGNEKQKRKKLNRASKIDSKAEDTKINVYDFNREQEINENIIVFLRSPNKDDKLTLAAKNIAPGLPVGEACSTGRKSKRKSIPTEKFTQSELFKSPQQTPVHKSTKKLGSPSKKVAKKNKLPVETSTKSETDDYSGDLKSFIMIEKLAEPEHVSEITESDCKSLSDIIKHTNVQITDTKCNPITETSEQPRTKNTSPKSNESIFRRAVKRKRLSSEDDDDDDDVIESSQDSSISNVSGAKLKLSLTRRCSIEPLAADIKQFIEENKKSEENTKGLLDTTDIVKDEIEVTPEELLKKRGRPSKKRKGRWPTRNSPHCTLESNVQTQSINDVTKMETSPEGKIRKKIGRPRKISIISESLFETFIDQPASNEESVNESQSLVSDDGKSTGSKMDIRNLEGEPKCLRRKSLEDPEGVDQSMGEWTENKTASKDESKPKRRRRRLRNTVQSKEFLSDSDGCTSEDSTIHTLEVGGKISPGNMSSIGKSKRGKHSVKLDKTSDEQDLMQEVKKQVFPEKLKESTDLDISTQNLQRGIQSQDTQTQDTPSMEIHDEIQLQFDVPEKPILNETDQEIARMDTASLSLGNFQELDMSSVVESNKTVMENKTLTIAEPDNTIYTDETKQDCQIINEIVHKVDMEEDNIILDNETVQESEGIVDSSEDTKQLPESSEIMEMAETEHINTQILETMDVQENVVVDNSSPVKEQTAENGFESSLPSSPITGDTPNRTSELLHCTSDISPIGSKSGSDKSNSDDEIVESRKLVPVALKFDEDADHDANKEKSPEKADDAPGKVDEKSPEKAEKNVDKASSSSPPKDEARTPIDVKTITERSNWFFDMVKCGSPATHRLFNKRKSGAAMSPSATRIKKLMSNVKAPSQGEDISDNVNQEDILTFTREVPSPLALPKSSILKRKHSDSADDGMSPCPKRKRVNFSDPCTTSKKVFIKEGGGSLQCLFETNPDDDLDKQFLDVLAANNIIDTPQTDSDNIETEQSLEIKNPMLLRDHIPIYPSLVDCDESVDVISRKLTSPMFVNALLSKLNSKNIKTIGDLAKESEVSIARLPFKTPMVASVYKALDNYYHKHFKSKANKEKQETRVNGVESVTGTEPLPRLEVALVKMDVKEELLKVLERAKCANIPSDTLCSLFFSKVDQKEVLKYEKANFNIETKDIIEEKDFPKLVKYIIDTAGLPKVFEILTKSLESSEEDSVYFECMIKHSIDKKPLSNLIEKRSLQELQAALWENVENGMYTRKGLIETCFLPFVNSLDLSPHFNKMTVVQIEEVLVKRLKAEDYPVFINRILKECSGNAEVNEELLNRYTVSELTKSIVNKGTPQEILSSFTYMFLSAEKTRDDLVQIFRLVSDSLVSTVPPTILRKLAIELLNKIPMKD